MDGDLIISLCTSWDYRFEQQYISLKKFISKNKRLPKLKDDKKLYKWLISQRRLYNNNRLPQKFITLLNFIPNWTWEKSNNWSKSYDEFCQFIKENGRLPQRKEKKGHWMYKQIILYFKKKLSQDRIKKLEEINLWDWNYMHTNYTWEIKFNRLLNYTRKYKQLPRKSCNMQLYNWRAYQIMAFSHNKLTEYQIDALNSIPLWTWKLRPRKKKDDIIDNINNS